MQSLTRLHTEVLKSAVRGAVNTFLEYDVKLLDDGIHEQSISHRIGLYLEDYFGIRTGNTLNIDCEYNNHLGEDKQVEIDIDFYVGHYPTCYCPFCTEKRAAEKEGRAMDMDLKNKEFRPDIIVHERGNDDRNRIAVEIKKSKICPFDLFKLHSMTMQRETKHRYQYDLGVSLYFVQHQPQFIWFVKGMLFQELTQLLPV